MYVYDAIGGGGRGEREKRESVCVLPLLTS